MSQGGLPESEGRNDRKVECRGGIRPDAFQKPIEAQGKRGVLQLEAERIGRPARVETLAVTGTKTHRACRELPADILKRLGDQGRVDSAAEQEQRLARDVCERVGEGSSNKLTKLSGRKAQVGLTIKSLRRSQGCRPVAGEAQFVTERHSLNILEDGTTRVTGSEPEDLRNSERVKWGAARTG